MKKPKQIDLEEVIARQPSAQEQYLDARGRELPDPTPIAPPIGYRRQPSLAEQIRQMVRSEKLAQELDARGVETFEEADDFDVGDDYDPQSPYEATFEPTPIPELRRRQAEAEAADQADDAGDPAQAPGATPSPKKGVSDGGPGQAPGERSKKKPAPVGQDLEE